MGLSNEKTSEAMDLSDRGSDGCIMTLRLATAVEASSLRSGSRGGYCMWCVCVYTHIYVHIYIHTKRMVMVCRCKAEL